MYTSLCISFLLLILVVTQDQKFEAPNEDRNHW